MFVVVAAHKIMLNILFRILFELWYFSPPEDVIPRIETYVERTNCIEEHKGC
jgi:hypothetical protein